MAFLARTVDYALTAITLFMFLVVYYVSGVVHSDVSTARWTDAMLKPPWLCAATPLRVAQRVRASSIVVVVVGVLNVRSVSSFLLFAAIKVE